MTDPAMPPTVPLVYRTSPNGRVHAAYLGSCRVGYVEERDNGRWMWQSIFLRPTGGAYFGKESDEGSAKALLEMSVHHWLVEAGLQLKEKSDATIESRDHDQGAEAAGRDEREHRPARSGSRTHGTRPRRGPDAEHKRTRKAR